MLSDETSGDDWFELRMLMMGKPVTFDDQQYQADIRTNFALSGDAKPSPWSTTAGDLTDSNRRLKAKIDDAKKELAPERDPKTGEIVLGPDGKPKMVPKTLIEDADKDYAADGTATTKTMDTQYLAEAPKPGATGPDKGAGKLIDKPFKQAVLENPIEVLADYVKSDAEAYIAAKKAVVDAIVTVLEVLGGIAISIATAGMAAPAMAVFFANLALQGVIIVYKNAALGGSYGMGNFGEDLIKAVGSSAFAGLSEAKFLKKLTDAGAGKITGKLFTAVEEGAAEKGMKLAGSQLHFGPDSVKKLEGFIAAGLKNTIIATGQEAYNFATNEKTYSMKLDEALFGEDGIGAKLLKKAPSAFIEGTFKAYIDDVAGVSHITRQGGPKGGAQNALAQAVADVLGNAAGFLTYVDNYSNAETFWNELFKSSATKAAGGLFQGWAMHRTRSMKMARDFVNPDQQITHEGLQKATYLDARERTELAKFVFETKPEMFSKLPIEYQQAYPAGMAKAGTTKPVTSPTETTNESSNPPPPPTTSTDADSTLPPPPVNDNAPKKVTPPTITLPDGSEADGFTTADGKKINAPKVDGDESKTATDDTKTPVIDDTKTPIVDDKTPPPIKLPDGTDADGFTTKDGKKVKAPVVGDEHLTEDQKNQKKQNPDEEEATDKDGTTSKKTTTTETDAQTTKPKVKMPTDTDRQGVPIDVPISKDELIAFVRKTQPELVAKFEANKKVDSGKAFNELIAQLEKLPAGSLAKVPGDEAKTAANDEADDKIMKEWGRIAKENAVPGYDESKIRNIYNEVEKSHMGIWEQKLAHLPVELQARMMHMYREELKAFMRTLMSDDKSIKLLNLRDRARYGSEKGPTFDSLVAEQKASGPNVTDDQAHQGVIDSSKRSNKKVNKDITGSEDGLAKKPTPVDESAKKDDTDPKKTGGGDDGVGGHKGADVYRTDGRTAVTGSEVKTAIESAVKSIAGAHIDARTDKTATMTVTTADGKVLPKVQLSFVTNDGSNMGSGPHDGAAKFKLTFDGEWRAVIELAPGIDAKDVKFVMVHELAEIAENVKRNPNAKPEQAAEIQAKIAADAKAGVFSKDGADKPSVHDIAVAQELSAQAKEWKRLLAEAGATKDASQKQRLEAEAEIRRASIEKLLSAHGIVNHEMTPAQAKLLQDAGAPDELAADIHTAPRPTTTAATGSNEPPKPKQVPKKANPGEIPADITDPDTLAHFQKAKQIYDQVATGSRGDQSMAEMRWKAYLEQHGIHVESDVSKTIRDLGVREEGAIPIELKKPVPQKSDSSVESSLTSQRPANAGHLNETVAKAAFAEVANAIAGAKVEGNLVTVTIDVNGAKKTVTIRMHDPNACADGQIAALKKNGDADFDVWASNKINDDQAGRALGAVIHQALAIARGGDAAATKSAALHGELDAMLVRLDAIKDSVEPGKIVRTSDDQDISAQAKENAKYESPARLRAELDMLLANAGVHMPGKAQDDFIAELRKTSPGAADKLVAHLAQKKSIGFDSNAVKKDGEHLPEPKKADKNDPASTVLPGEVASKKPLGLDDHKAVIELQLVFAQLKEIDVRVAQRDQKGTKGAEIAQGETMRRVELVNKAKALMASLGFGGSDPAYYKARLAELEAVFPGSTSTVGSGITERIEARQQSLKTHKEADTARIEASVKAKEITDKILAATTGDKPFITDRLVVGDGLAALTNVATLGKMPKGDDGFVDPSALLVVGGPDLLAKMAQTDPTMRWGQRAAVFDGDETHAMFKGVKGQLNNAQEDGGDFATVGAMADTMDLSRKQLGLARVDATVISVELKGGQTDWHQDASGQVVRIKMMVGGKLVTIYANKTDITTGLGALGTPDETVLSKAHKESMFKSGAMIGGDSIMTDAKVKEALKGKRVLVLGYGPTAAWAAKSAVDAGAVMVDWTGSSTKEKGSDANASQLAALSTVDRVSETTDPKSKVKTSTDRVVTIEHVGEGGLVTFSSGEGAEMKTYKVFYDKIAISMGYDTTGTRPTNDDTASPKKMIGDMKLGATEEGAGLQSKEHDGAVRVLGGAAFGNVNVKDQKDTDQLKQNRESTKMTADSPQIPTSDSRVAEFQDTAIGDANKKQADANNAKNTATADDKDATTTSGTKGPGGNDPVVPPVTSTTTKKTWDDPSLTFDEFLTQVREGNTRKKLSDKDIEDLRVKFGAGLRRNPGNGHLVEPPTKFVDSGKKWDADNVSDEEALNDYRARVKSSSLDDVQVLAKIEAGLRYNPDSDRWENPDPKTKKKSFEESKEDMGKAEKSRRTVADALAAKAGGKPAPKLSAELDTAIDQLVTAGHMTEAEGWILKRWSRLHAQLGGKPPAAELLAKLGVSEDKPGFNGERYEDFRHAVLNAAVDQALAAKNPMQAIETILGEGLSIMPDAASRGSLFSKFRRKRFLDGTGEVSTMTNPDKEKTDPGKQFNGPVDGTKDLKDGPQKRFSDGAVKIADVAGLEPEPGRPPVGQYAADDKAGASMDPDQLAAVNRRITGDSAPDKKDGGILMGNQDGVLGQDLHKMAGVIYFCESEANAKALADHMEKKGYSERMHVAYFDENGVLRWKR